MPAVGKNNCEYQQQVKKQNKKEYQQTNKNIYIGIPTADKNKKKIRVPAAKEQNKYDSRYQERQAELNRRMQDDKGGSKLRRNKLVVIVIDGWVSLMEKMKI